MSVDFDAIARSGRCDVSSLRLALPLLEQGYTPPFLARYRTDELSGIDEASLWALSRAVKVEQLLAARRQGLKASWEKTSLRDPAIGQAIDKANTTRVIARLANRLKTESSDAVSDATRLASRILNPQKGDGSDLAAIASKVDGIDDASAAINGLDDAIATRLMGDPRIIATATRWLAKNAKIYIESISDPHGAADEAESVKKKGKRKEKKAGDEQGRTELASAESASSADASAATPDPNEPISEVASTEATNAGSPDTAVLTTEAPSSDALTTETPGTAASTTAEPRAAVPIPEAPSAEAPGTETPGTENTRDRRFQH